VSVTSAEEVLRLVGRGMQQRATGATNLNERSSRSHSILMVEVEVRGVAM
jgi:kinesin family member C2/C3